MGLIFYFCLTGQRWFPILDNANLAFHEFGHPFFRIFSERLMVYGGTIAQLIFPIGVSIYFYSRQDTFQMSIGILWGGQNLLNIARYMRDARAQELPLVGGGEHDWTEIFIRWNVLQNDIKISDHLIKLTILALLAQTYYMYTKLEK